MPPCCRRLNIEEVLTMTAKQIKAIIAARRENVKYLTQKAIRVVIDCMESGDYSTAHSLKLYQYNSACYCELLEVLSENKKALAK